MREEIEIQIAPDGSVQYTIKGIKGSACESISELLKRLGSVVKEQNTSEFYDLEDETHVAVGGN